VFLAYLPGIAVRPPVTSSDGASGENFEGLLIMKWQFFVGACFLTGALLLPHASPRAVVSGMALAALLRWLWDHTGGGPR
jgi:hypothetical protein